ncbi:hypothetical protein NXW09_27900 [Bacteroides ovatus]|nr:hypothetical protein [Bacteroides ovatus]
MNDVDYNRFMDAYEDSLARRGIQEKNHRLGEVVVKSEEMESRERHFRKSLLSRLLITMCLRK